MLFVVQLFGGWHRLSMANIFLRLLDEKHSLLIDGATGTNLFELGLQSGDSPEFWNVDFPDRGSRTIDRLSMSAQISC